MWSALSNSKLRLGEAHSAALDHELRTAEDALTGMVFGRLAYLPNPVAWRIVIDAATVLRGKRPSPVDAFRQELWPTLRPPRGSSRRYVEPDVLWTHDAGAVGIEVKWRDAQRVDQLLSEHAAISTRTPTLPVTMVCLGNVSPTVRMLLAETCTVPTLLALTWLDLRRAIDLVLAADGLSSEHRRVLLDLTAILEARGLRRTATLASLGSLMPPRTTALDALRRWSPAR